MPFDPADHLDASLDFSEDVAATRHPRAAPSLHFPFPFDYPRPKSPLPPNASNTTSGFLKHLDTMELPPLPITTKSNHNNNNNNINNNSDSNKPNGTALQRLGPGVNGGGYSPPAWRRLGNGDQSSGFWRKRGDDLLIGHSNQQHQRRGSSRRREDSGHEYDSYDDLYDDEDDDFGQFEDDVDDILAAAIRTRLPTGSLSPEKEISPEPEKKRSPELEKKRSPEPEKKRSPEPEKKRSPEPEYKAYGATAAAHQQQQQQESRYSSASPGALNVGRMENGDARIKSEEPDAEDLKATLAALPAAQKENGRERDPDNYIRFAVRASVQQRSEPIEAVITQTRGLYRTITASPASLLLSILLALMTLAASRALFDPTGRGGAGSSRPVPDLVKVAGIARSFEPLIYYSEHGVGQVGELQATGVAVWDLGESVRSSNLTSAPIIVRELDALSESLKTLAIELTRFFANVDGDVDGILIVMDWARRELTQVLPANLPTSPLSSLFSNLHALLSSLGGPLPFSADDFANGNIDAHAPSTILSRLATHIFGVTNPQRTRATLQRTFNEFLAVLEQAIADELQHSLALFGLFEAIDQQFLNIARTVARESHAQDEQHAEVLSSLWTRILGSRHVATYERNRLLLLNVREKTVRNKGLLVEHNHKLLALKVNLEALRRKLVSPLVRSVNSSTLSVEEQIRGLEDVGGYLEGVRARQKAKLMEMLYGSGSGSGMAAHGRGVEGGGGERLLDGKASTERVEGGRRRLF